MGRSYLRWPCLVASGSGAVKVLRKQNWDAVSEEGGGEDFWGQGLLVRVRCCSAGDYRAPGDAGGVTVLLLLEQITTN